MAPICWPFSFNQQILVGFLVIFKLILKPEIETNLDFTCFLFVQQTLLLFLHERAHWQIYCINNVDDADADHNSNVLNFAKSNIQTLVIKLN